MGENETAPEYIWANIEEEDDQEPYIEYLSDEPWSPENPGVKYVRADIHASLTADKERLEARAAELEKAVQALLDCPDIADNDYKDEETHAAERLARATLDEGGR